MKFTKKETKEHTPTLEEGFEYLFNKGAALVNKQEKKRDHKHFHVSSIGYCLRSVYLKTQADEKGVLEEADLSFLRKVNLGSLVHELYQKYLMHSGNLYCPWYCKRCGTTTAPGFAPTACECGDKAKWEPSEFQFMNAKYKVSGHPDGFVKILKPNLTLIEIKTISPYYKIAEGPQVVQRSVPEHIQQCNFYLHLMQDPSTLIPGVDKDFLVAALDKKRFLLVYSDKGTDKVHPYPFKADKALYEKDLARVELYHKCVKEGKEPPAEPGPKACRYCAFLKGCKGNG